MVAPAKMEHLLDLPVRLEATLPGPALRVSELLALEEGSLIRTNRAAGETADIFAAGSLIGCAELMAANGRRAARMLRFDRNC